MSKEKQNDELVQMYRDLAEIFDEEYEKRRLITPQNTAEKMTAKGYRKQSDGEWESDPSDDPRVDDGCVCSQCRRWVRASVAAGCFYCPSCGAKMRKEDERE